MVSIFFRFTKDEAENFEKFSLFLFFFSLLYNLLLFILFYFNKTAFVMKKKFLNIILVVLNKIDNVMSRSQDLPIT